MGLWQGLWADPHALTALETATMQRIDAQEQARRAAMDAAWLAYRGLDEDEDDAAADPDEPPIRLNKLATVLDTATAFLFAPPPTYDLPEALRRKAKRLQPPPPPDPTEPPADPNAPPPGPAPEIKTTRERWLEDCLRANAWEALLVDVRTNGGVTGTAYAKTLPPDADHPFPQLQALDSTAMRIQTDPRDVQRVQAYIWEANATIGIHGKPVHARQVTQRAGAEWVIIDQEKPLDARPAQDWTTVQTTDWHYPWPPIVHCKNLPNANDVYGQPDIPARIIELATAINLQYTNDAQVQHYQGHPIIYTTGLSTGGLDIRPDRMNHLPLGATVNSLAPKLDPAAAQQLRKELLDAFDEMTHTPAITRGRTDIGNPSGVALAIQFWPMDKKIALLRMLYEPFMTEILRRLLELGGKGNASTVTWTWPKVLPVDMLAQRQALAIEATEGWTSKATIAAELDRDWPTEQANLAEERAAAQAAEPPPLVPVDPATGQPLQQRLPPPGVPPPALAAHQVPKGPAK